MSDLWTCVASKNPVDTKVLFLLDYVTILLKSVLVSTSPLPSTQLQIPCHRNRRDPIFLRATFSAVGSNVKTEILSSIY